LCPRVATIGGLAQPDDRFRRVLRNTIAVRIHQPQIELCIQMALARRLHDPPRRFGIVSYDAFTGCVSDAEVELRISVARFSRLTHANDVCVVLFDRSLDDTANHTKGTKHTKEKARARPNRSCHDEPQPATEARPGVPRIKPGI
jgi:hypothetical protein